MADAPSGLDNDVWYRSAMSAVPVRHAATVLVVRDGSAGVEVLMMRRSMTASFLPGAYVFPGGVVDEDDGDHRLFERVRGRSDAEASAILGVSHHGLAFWVAAVRECFEESGLLLARSASQFGTTQSAGNVVNRVVNRTADHAEVSLFEDLSASRSDLLTGAHRFSAVLERHDAVVDADAIVPWSRWVTPIGGPRRFDTRFFVTTAPTVSDLSAHEHEMSDLRWFSPNEALDDPDVMLITPTVSALRLLARSSTSAEALASARERVGERRFKDG